MVQIIYDDWINRPSVGKWKWRDGDEGKFGSGRKVYRKSDHIDKGSREIQVTEEIRGYSYWKDFVIGLVKWKDEFRKGTKGYRKFYLTFRNRRFWETFDWHTWRGRSRGRWEGEYDLSGRHESMNLKGLIREEDEDIEVYTRKKTELKGNSEELWWIRLEKHSQLRTSRNSKFQWNRVFINGRWRNKPPIQRQDQNEKNQSSLSLHKSYICDPNIGGTQRIHLCFHRDETKDHRRRVVGKRLKCEKRRVQKITKVVTPNNWKMTMSTGMSNPKKFNHPGTKMVIKLFPRKPNLETKRNTGQKKLIVDRLRPH